MSLVPLFTGPLSAIAPRVIQPTADLSIDLFCGGGASEGIRAEVFDG